MAKPPGRPAGPKDRIRVGRIVGAHGVRGLVRLRSYTAEPDAIAAYGPLTDDSGRRLVIALAGRIKGDRLARIEGIGDRTAAEALKGRDLYVERSALPPPEEEEFYHADLLGLRADRPDGEWFGTVVAVHDFGAGDVLEIARPAGEIVTVPFTRTVVPLVDLAAGRIVVEPPEGLLDADSTEASRGPDPSDATE